MPAAARAASSPERAASPRSFRGALNRAPMPGFTRARKDVSAAKNLPELIARAAEPLPDFDDAAFGAAFERFAAAKVVLLGEASHGTSEFYRARAAITRRLIERHGFTIVAPKRIGR